MMVEAEGMGGERELPKGWTMTALGAACDICDNLRKPINAEERLKRNNGIDPSKLYPYYGATGQVGYIDGYLTDGEYVLLGEDAAPFLDIGKNVAYMIKGKTWVNNHAHILCSHFNNAYLLHFLNQVDYRDYVTGTTRLKLTQSALLRIPLILAPLPEQERIVAKIEELFSSLEAGVASLTTAQEQLKLYRQAVLKRAFEGRLTTLHSIPLRERGENGAVDQFRSLSRTKTQVELPEGWIWENIGAIAEQVSDGPFGSNLKSSDYVTKGVRVVRLENIGILTFRDEYKSFVTQEKYATIKKHTVHGGDIIFSSFITDSIRATILPEYIIKAINKADCFLVRTADSKINKKYLSYFFMTREMYGKLVGGIHGATRPRINISQLKATTIPYAPLPEQQLIVAEIERRLSVCDKLEESIRQGLEQAEALKQSILKKAFKGRLVPQDPNDEPASALLERIALVKSRGST
jgi:type I restriction enzyme, S subunit